LIIVDSKLSAETIESVITVPRNIRKYFIDLTLRSKYDTKINAEKSIIIIPHLSIILPLAWITGYDVYVDEVDKTFTESMQSLQQQFKKMYPRAPFKTQIIADRLVENNDAPEGTALLFSGGVDSTYSLYRNRHLNPRLVMIYGLWDIPTSNREYIEMIREEYAEFTKREGFRLNIVHTNIQEALDRRRIEHYFWRFDHGEASGYLNGLAGPLGHLSQLAPLSIERFNHILISASFKIPEDEETFIKANLYSSFPSTDEKIRWANIQVTHHGTIFRHNKVSALKKYLEQKRMKLRVCGENERFHSNTFNCNKCEKCLRTITALALAGIDPNECGFNADDSTFQLLKSHFIKGKMDQRHILCWCRPLQKIIPDEINQDYYGSKGFFEWYKTFNLEDVKTFKKTDRLSKLLHETLALLYFKSPYTLTNTLRRIFYEAQDSSSVPILSKYLNRVLN
jgi:hypothetical protein